jgi:hypothetical protein
VSSRSRDQDLIDWLAAKIQEPAELAETVHPAHNNGRIRTAPSSDEVIIQKCRAAENAVKFSNLFDQGDTRSYHGGDDSRADLALVSMLAFYTQDEAQLERLFSSSALGRREKWLRRDDYRKRTIRKALADLGKVYDWSRIESHERRNGARSRSRSLGNKVMSNDPKRSIRAVSFRGREKPGPREWIVEKAVCRGHAASWYGEGGIAKSLLAAHMGLHVAADGVGYWAGLRVQTIPVIYGDFELDEDEHLRRAQELSYGMGLSDVPTKFHYLSGGTSRGRGFCGGGRRVRAA